MLAALDDRQRYVGTCLLQGFGKNLTLGHRHRLVLVAVHDEKRRRFAVLNLRREDRVLAEPVVHRGHGCAPECDRADDGDAPDDLPERTAELVANSLWLKKGRVA